MTSTFVGFTPLFDVHRVQEVFRVFHMLTVVQKKGSVYLQEGSLNYSSLLGSSDKGQN